ncbi:Transmembrane protease serine 11B [Coemansia sp. RSA 1939]|nr:Transmembrane protease serine 11B [Coemansia sp. RSA 1939]
MIVKYFLLVIILGLHHCVLADTAEPSSSKSKRIYNGYNIQDGIVPSAAFLTVISPNGSERLCGATIISPEHLITAAHCLQQPNAPYNSSVEVTVSYNSNNKGSQKNATIQNVYINPDSITNGAINPLSDIAVIEVVEMSGKYAKSIPIYMDTLTENESIIATGWGQKTNTTTAKSVTALQGAKLHVGNSDDCSKYSSDFKTDSDALVCTLSQSSNSSNICVGDAGTPAYIVNSSKKSTLVGIATRVFTADTNYCGSDNAASMFLRASYHIDYILGINYGEGNFTCGATFISSEYLVTAAHCVENSTYPYQPSKDTLRIGYNSGDLTKQLTAKVLEAWPHPKYIVDKDSTDPRYDITVLRVAPISAPYTKPNLNVAIQEP